VLPVADSDRWLKPEAIGSYYGNLYVLDPLLGHILKYEPSDNAYTQPPSYYVNPGLQMDLTGAVDMAIDGNVYVLFADGRIEKFFNGEPRSFTLAGLPSPMTSPTTIFVSGEKEPEADGHIYVTDTGNERIVEFDKEGNFLRQFRDNPGDTHLAGLRGLYVDDERGRMFILSGTALWLVNLPTP
jgi:DNA-binding beta-propeller fold protein YncE